MDHQPREEPRVLVVNRLPASEVARAGFSPLGLVVGALQVILARLVRSEDLSQAEEHPDTGERAVQQGDAPLSRMVPA